MTQTKQRPYGLWESPLKAEDLAGELRFSDAQWDAHSGNLLWREERSDRGVVVSRSQEGSCSDLGGNLSVQARVGYGGGDFTVSHGIAYFVSKGRIFRQSLAKKSPRPITPAWGQCASPAVSPDGKHLVYVHSAEEIDAVALVDTQGHHWPVKLTADHDFYMQPCWHPQGRELAWIAWDHPNMPWNGTALYLGQISAGEPVPVLTDATILTGSPSGSTAVFQPAFSPDGKYLSYLSNENGWFSLYLLDLISRKTELAVGGEAELGVPAWVQGVRTHGWFGDAKTLYFLELRNGFTSLMQFDIYERSVSRVGDEMQTYSVLGQIAPNPITDEITVIASSSKIPPRIVSFSADGNEQIYRRSSKESVGHAYLSEAEPVSWTLPEAAAVRECHGLFYPPVNADFESSGLPPAVIKIHGGPTSQYTAGYHPDTQFLTSRGFAVLELNYRGSSGYGKAYMNALRGNWGAMDIRDTRSAAEHLTAEGLADPDRIALMGGSAGGYTILLCLIAYPGFFRAGVCRYGVSNLFTLATDTHKFERHYLDWLVGSLPEHDQRYRERSPEFLAQKIQDPVAIFQGDEDRVVPKSQSDAIVKSLTDRGIPHLYRIYQGEGHGWKKSETIRDYYETVEEFLRQHVL